MRFAVKMQCSY